MADDQDKYNHLLATPAVVIHSIFHHVGQLIVGFGPGTLWKKK